MILVISTCEEKFHELEFVKPIEDILRMNKLKFITRHYKKIDKSNLKKASKVIICGTSLKDNHFIDNIKKFDWLKDFDKPVFGICAGMQIIGLVYNGKIKKKKEIGFYEVDFKKAFLGLKGKRKVYQLHNYSVDSKEFDFLADKNAMKHKSKEIYGVIFHPEVRNKELIEGFLRV